MCTDFRCGDIVDNRGAIVNSRTGSLEVVGSKPPLLTKKDKNWPFAVGSSCYSTIYTI
jgi:hypothetical protein